MTAIRIGDGGLEWTARLPSDSRPAGAGAFFADCMLAPLSNAQALVLDTATGKQRQQLRIGPEGLLGNLATDGDAVYSQSFTGLARFDLASVVGVRSPHALAAQQKAVLGKSEDAIALLLDSSETLSDSAASSTLSDLLSARVDPVSATPELHRVMEQLGDGQPVSPQLRVARLTQLARDEDRDAFVSELLAFCSAGGDDPLLPMSNDRAVRASRYCRELAFRFLDRASHARLRAELLRLEGPNRRALTERVLPPERDAEASPLGVATTDDRWASRQVHAARLAREAKARPSTRTRPTGDPVEFVLPLQSRWRGSSRLDARLVGVSDGRLVGLNHYGEEFLNIEMPRNSPDRLQRMASTRVPVTARQDGTLVASTGEDVIAIGALERGPQAVRWSARQVLLAEGSADLESGDARLAAAIRAAASDEVRLIGVSPHGVAVAADELVACLDLQSGVVAWVADSLDAGGGPTADGDSVYSAPTVRPGWRLSLVDGSRSVFAAPSGKVVAVEGAIVALVTSQDDLSVLELYDRRRERVVLRRELGRRVQSEHIDDLLVVVDESGALEIFDLSTRETLLTDRVELSGKVTGVSAVRMADRLFVGVNLSATHAHRAAGATPVDSNPVITGPVMGYHLPTGQAMWPTPARVEQKALLARQPHGCPVLTLAANVKTNDATGRYDALHVLMLDAATGRTLHSEVNLRNEKASEYRIRFDQRDRARYTLALDSRYVVLDLLDSPAPPAPPHTASVEQPKPTDLWSVGSALGKLLGEGLREQDDKPANPAPDDE